MRLRKEYLLLALIFSASLALRLYLAFSSDTFGYDAYFNIRQAQNLKEDFSASYSDSLYF